MYFEEEDNVLEEMNDLKNKKNRDFTSIVNKRKVSKFEMDDFFMGG